MADELVAELDAREARYALTARKRNERRLRELRKAYRARAARPSGDTAEGEIKPGDIVAKVVPFQRPDNDDTYTLSHMR